MRRTLILIMSITLLLTINLVNAHNFTETKQLIDSKISCDSLSNSQLEAIGDYYMEQMHPGEAHELMHKMMGGEDSETVKQMHIQMAKSIYCGENSGMMGSGMMGMMNMIYSQSSMMQGAMGSFGYNTGYWNFLNILYVILLIGLIVLVFLGIVKLWKNITNKGVKRKRR